MPFFSNTSGTPEVCQLPAGIAEKNKLVLYPSYVVLKNKIITGQQYGSAAVRTEVKNTEVVQQWGRWYCQAAPVEGRYLIKKKSSSPTGRKKTPTYGTAHPPTTDNAVHPPPTHRPNLYYIYSIGVSHTACKDEFRRNLRSHRWSVFSFFIICSTKSNRTQFD